MDGLKIEIGGYDTVTRWMKKFGKKAVIPIYKIFDPLAGAESCSGKAGASCWVETLLEAPNAASPTLCPVLWMRALEEVAAFPDQSGTPVPS